MTPSDATWPKRLAWQHMCGRCWTASPAPETRSGAGWLRLGVTGMLVPEEYDGAGMTMVEAGVVAEELGAALYPGPWSVHRRRRDAGAAAYGAGRNAAALLTGIADGSTIATVGPLGWYSAVGDRDGRRHGPERRHHRPAGRSRSRRHAGVRR